MVVYVTSFIAILLITILSRKSNAPSYYYISLLIILVVAGLRSQYVGTDTFSYVKMFTKNIFDEEIEYGFKLLIKTIQTLTSDYPIFLSLVACVQYFTLLFFLKKYSADISFSLLLFLSLGFFFFYLSGMRQSIAISLFLISLHFFNQESYIKSLFFFILATSCHTTVLLFFPILLISKYIYFNSKLVYVLVIISILIGVSGKVDVPNLLDSLGLYNLFQSQGVLDRYKGYSDYTSDLDLAMTFNGYLRIVIIPSIVFLATYYYSENKNDLFLKIYFIGLIISNLLSSFPIGYRLSLYGTVLSIVVIPNVFFKNKLSHLYYPLFYFYCLAIFLNEIISAYGIQSSARNDIVPYLFFWND